VAGRLYACTPVRTDHGRTHESLNLLSYSNSRQAALPGPCGAVRLVVSLGSWATAGSAYRRKRRGAVTGTGTGYLERRNKGEKAPGRSLAGSCACSNSHHTTVGLPRQSWCSDSSTAKSSQSVLARKAWTGLWTELEDTGIYLYPYPIPLHITSPRRRTPNQIKLPSCRSTYHIRPPSRTQLYPVYRKNVLRAWGLERIFPTEGGGHSHTEELRVY